MGRACWRRTGVGVDWGVGSPFKGLKCPARDISSWGFIPRAEGAPDRWGVTSQTGPMLPGKPAHHPLCLALLVGSWSR